jgi:hypothetical protein
MGSRKNRPPKVAGIVTITKLRTAVTKCTNTLRLGARGACPSAAVGLASEDDGDEVISKDPDIGSRRGCCQRDELVGLLRDGI